MSRKKTSIQPHVSAFSFPPSASFPDEPVALRTEKGTRNQIRSDEGTYIWGIDDALPLRILKAVDESPTAMACLTMAENFIAGSGFSDNGLMTMPVDKYGTTLWDLHIQLCVYMAQLDGFSVNFKLDPSFKITNTYAIHFETARFVAPPEGSRKVETIKVNPYFGTSEYHPEYTSEYPVWDGDKTGLAAQIKKFGESKFPGQIYFYGIKRPLYKHYTAPKFWSASDAIYSDAKMMEFLRNTLKNGFFQSTSITMIGDPDQPSMDPSHQSTETGTDGVKRKKSTKTRAQAFDEYMSSKFSGTSKAGTGLVLWAMDKDKTPVIQAFPSNLNFDLLSGTEVTNMRKITVATQVPAILVNLPQQENSLGSDGASIERSIELMQARTVAKRVTLEQFYNTVLLPNLQAATGARVKINEYRPVSKMVDVPDKVWETLTQESKIAFIKKNYPDIPIVETVTPPTPNTGLPAAPVQSDPNQEAVDSLLRSMSRSELAKFYGYVNDYKKGRATLEQTKVFLKAYKLSDEQIMLFLNEI